MDFFIYNTLTRKKEKFEPYYIDGKKDFVWIYTCGPTVYSDPHLGNLRAFVFAGLLWDTIRNILYLPTKHVLNITDVGHLSDDWDDGEDKLEKWASREWTTAWDIASKYEKNFMKYMSDLSLNFDFFPRATDNISEQIEIIKDLESKWFTYIIKNDWVYMDTSKISDYWKLIWDNYQKHIEWLQQWARVSNDNKRNITDFALWKFSPSSEKRHMEWDSPWWVWFPGWHLECSAMSRKYLWDFFDIHTWGVDHITTHHTNEIAQSECSFAWDNWSWVKYWMHSQFLNIDWSKISKSAWHTLSIPDLIEKWYSSYDLRYFYLTAHYRSFLDFTWEALDRAHKTRNNIVKKLVSNKHINSLNAYWMTFSDIQNLVKNEDSLQLLKELTDALLDDLNTPKFLSILNKNINKLNYESMEIVAWFDYYIVKLWLIEDAKNLIYASNKIKIPYYIQQLAQERRKAKVEKNFKKADEIRDKLYYQWFVVKDFKDTYIIKHKLDEQ